MNTHAILLFGYVVGVLMASGISAGEIDAVERSHALAVVKGIFGRLDCDLDGTIDPTEVDDHIAQLWHPIDRDQSRVLSKGEYALIHRSVPDTIGAVLFHDADANSDGNVNVTEFRRHLQRMIVKVDSDGDREVSLSEVGLKPMPIFRKNPFVTAKPVLEGS